MILARSGVGTLLLPPTFTELDGFVSSPCPPTGIPDDR